MCKTISTRYFGCGGDHVEYGSKECPTAKTKRSKGIWFDCVLKQCNHWSDEKCPVCKKTPAKKLARVLKNPIHTIRFFTEKNVNIQSFEPEGDSNEIYLQIQNSKKASYREIPYWQMIQHVKIEIALISNQNAMSGQATPGDIIGQILA